MNEKYKTVLTASAALALIGAAPPHSHDPSPGPDTPSVPELSFFERAELPQAEMLNDDEYGEKLIDSYPMETIQPDFEGEITISVLVTPKGRATACHIRRSSGNFVLDQWACRGAEHYARFARAQDKRGKPVWRQWTDTIAVSTSSADADPVKEDN